VYRFRARHDVVKICFTPAEFHPKKQYITPLFLPRLGFWMLDRMVQADRNHNKKKRHCGER
jgi:hypothetical protein